VDRLLSVKINKIESRKEVETHLLNRGLELGVVYFLMKNLKRDTATGGYQWKANIQALWNNYDYILASTIPAKPIMQPILFAAGEKSNYITNADMELIIESYPNYCNEVIEGAGHWVHADNLVGLLEAVLRFLEN